MERPDPEIKPDAASEPPPPPPPPPTCDVCGSDRLVWIRCKLICQHCRSINMSCGDL